MKSSIEPNEYSAIKNDENESFIYDKFDQLLYKYNIPFTQTSFSRMELSIFTSKLRENENVTDKASIIRRNWLLIIKNYLLSQRLNTILDHTLKVKLGAHLFLQRKFFRLWANKTTNFSNRDKWIRIASIVRQINWIRKARDYSSRLDKQRIDIAAKYLISRSEYQNPQYNFFIRKALPILTDKQKKIIEEELEDDKQADMSHFQGVNDSPRTEISSITGISEGSFS